MIGNSPWVIPGKDYPEYDMQIAFIYYIISNLRFISGDLWNPKMPRVTKYPRASTITINALYQHFCTKLNP